MSKAFRKCSLLAIAGCLLLAQSVIVQSARAQQKPASAKGATPKTKNAAMQTEEGVNGNLVTTKWLADHLKSPDVLLLDASSPPLYASNHIPGAISANPYDLMTFGTGPMPVTQTEAFYQKWGINSP